MFGNNGCIWIILIIILLFCCNGNGNVTTFGGCGRGFNSFNGCNGCCD